MNNQTQYTHAHYTNNLAFRKKIKKRRGEKMRKSILKISNLSTYLSLYLSICQSNLSIKCLSVCISLTISIYIQLPDISLDRSIISLSVVSILSNMSLSSGEYIWHIWSRSLNFLVYIKKIDTNLMSGGGDGFSSLCYLVQLAEKS